MDEKEFFRQATLKISSSLMIEVAMERCLDFLKQHVPASGMVFGMYDPNLNVGRVLAAIWPPHLKKPGDTIHFPSEFWEWIKNRWKKAPGITIINDVHQEDVPTRQTMSLIWPAETSHLIMDLELEGERLGSFGIFVEEKHRYHDRHAHLISLLHDPFSLAMSNIIQHQEIRRLTDMLADDNRYLHRELLKVTGDTIVGADFGLRDVMQMVGQVAPLESPVLLMGETGVGKEVIANAIHSSSSRRNHPYIKVNCGAIPENLIDSELFGHEKGAFTGAIARKRGRFERAHTGTIFLDEVGDLPLAAQTRLLRVLQQHEIERVGGSGPIPVDVRIISATHRNLAWMVKSGEFREDLWFRLNVFPIVIPPLRSRTEDIPALLAHFLERKSKELKIQHLPSPAPGTIETCQAYEWPGNVRELENLVERALIFNQMPGNDGLLRFDILSSTHMPVPAGTAQCPDQAIRPLDEVMADHIENALHHSGGRVEGKNGAAQLLGLHPSTLRARMRKLGIHHGKSRQSSRRTGRSPCRALNGRHWNRHKCTPDKMDFHLKETP